MVFVSSCRGMHKFIIFIYMPRSHIGPKNIYRAMRNCNLVNYVEIGCWSVKQYY